MSGFHFHFISTSASSAVTAQLGTRLSHCCCNRRWMPVLSCEPAGRASSQPSSNRMGQSGVCPSRTTALQSTCKSRACCNPSQRGGCQSPGGPRCSRMRPLGTSHHLMPQSTRCLGCSSRLFPAAQKCELYLNTSLSRQARCSG